LFRRTGEYLTPTRPDQALSTDLDLVSREFLTTPSSMVYL
jgi:hypothetical protein